MKAKNKWAIGIVLAAFLVLVMNSSLQGVDTREINRVRNKSMLDDEDRQIIDEFIAEAIGELVKTIDFTSVSKLRRDILTSRGSQVQYAEQFSVSAHKHISEGLKAADELSPEERRFKVVVNLLILVDGLEDLRLADLAMERLNDERAAIRYWAVHALTNSGIIKQLSSTNAAELRLAKKIAEELKKLVEKSGPEVMVLMAKFAAEIKIAEGEELLLAIADARTRRYADWTVRYALLDATILELLCEKMSAGAEPGMARRFGQLCSYVMQKYISDISGEGFLSDSQRQQLASVLVEIEQSCIQRLFDEPQLTIRRAVGKGDSRALLWEHNRLLGEEGQAGALALKLNFDYGRKPDGSRRTSPLTLPTRPEAKTSE